jgi:hypothetical protein
MEFEPNMTYYCHHVPTNEDWIILGVNPTRGTVAAAGWPATIAQLSDCTNWEKRGKISDTEHEYLKKAFGGGWL